MVDYSVAGLITGAMYKISLGPKGMISGAFFGAVLGTFAGLITIPLLFISGVSMDDIYDSAHVYFRTKDELFHGCYKVSFCMKLLYSEQCFDVDICFDFCRRS